VPVPMPMAVSPFYPSLTSPVISATSEECQFRTHALQHYSITSSACTGIGVDPLALGEGIDECVDLLLIRTLASGVDARTCCVTDPQDNFVWSRRVMDQHRGRIEGIEIPTLVEGPIDEIHGRAWRADLGVAWNDDAAAFYRAAHRHAESRMDHRCAVFEVAERRGDGAYAQAKGLSSCVVRKRPGPRPDTRPKGRFSCCCCPPRITPLLVADPPSRLPPGVYRQP
jgi:hypothetical protein